MIIILTGAENDNDSRNRLTAKHYNDVVECLAARLRDPWGSLFMCACPGSAPISQANCSAFLPALISLLAYQCPGKPFSIGVPYLALHPARCVLMSAREPQRLAPIAPITNDNSSLASDPAPLPGGGSRSDHNVPGSPCSLSEARRALSGGYR